MLAKTPSNRTYLSYKQKLQVWDVICHWLSAEGWAQDLLNGDVVSNKSVATRVLPTVLDFPVSPASVDSLRRAHGFTFRDKAIRVKKSNMMVKAPEPDKIAILLQVMDRMMERQQLLVAAYTEIYEWATRNGYDGLNRFPR